MVGSSSRDIVEEREAVMVSPTGGVPTLRPAHFLKPLTDSVIVGPLSKLELHSLSLSSSPAAFQVRLSGWKYQQKNWRIWVQKMASLHESTWRKAGIFEAIMNSTYRIVRNDDLLFGVAERWFNETKSFIFPWGEATITLEDVMILGGYSVLGSPVFSALETKELKDKQGKLVKAWIEVTELRRRPSKKANQGLWMKKFMNTDSEIEHEGFLAFWLSRFVFPSGFNTIVISVLPIAMHLARGTRIALAPAVLANIYRDLSSLKQIIHEKNRDHRLATLTFGPPFQLLLVWTWERFLELRPEPNLIRNGESRMARWQGLRSEVKNVRLVLDSAKGSFDWRPYAKSIKNWKFHKFYVEREMWLSVDSGLDDEVLSFFQCLRVSELVALDTIQQYLPHRVAMQFGLDQDLPGCVARSNGSFEIAWGDYSRPVGGGRLYIPSRHFEADVTTRYLEWLKESVSCLKEHRGSGNFETTPKESRGIQERDSISSFVMIPKNLKSARKGSAQPASSSVKRLRTSGWISTPRKKGINASSALSIARKLNRIQNKEVDYVGPPLRFLKCSAHSSERKEENGALVSVLKSTPKILRGSVECSDGKRKTMNAASPIVIDDSDSSDCLVLILDVEKKAKGKYTSASSPSRTSKEVPDDFRVKKELDNSPIPPGFQPKSKMVKAKCTDGEDNMPITEHLKSFCKHEDDFERSSLPDRHSSDSCCEDKLTLLEMLICSKKAQQSQM